MMIKLLKGQFLQKIIWKRISIISLCVSQGVYLETLKPPCIHTACQSSLGEIFKAVKVK